MDLSIRPNPFAIMSAHGLASLALSFSMMKKRAEAGKMLICSVIQRAVEVYFQPLCFEPYAPMLMGFCATALVQKCVLGKETQLPFLKAAYINLGSRFVILATVAAFLGTELSTNNVAAMAITSFGAATASIWAISKIAKKIFPQERPKTA